MKKIEKFTIDNVRKGADVSKYHDWLKRQRDQEKLELISKKNRIYWWQNKETIAEKQKQYRERNKVV